MKSHISPGATTLDLLEYKRLRKERKEYQAPTHTALPVTSPFSLLNGPITLKNLFKLGKSMDSAQVIDLETRCTSLMPDGNVITQLMALADIWYIDIYDNKCIRNIIELELQQQEKEIINVENK